MRRALPILLALVASLALVACGDDGDGGDGEPSGELTSLGIGEVVQGTTTDEVRDLFGDPAREETGPGCELGGPGNDTITWTYELEGGVLILNFASASGELAFYRTTSPTLRTNNGDKVGDPFSSLEANWGGDLEPVPIGSGPSEEAGLWWVRDGDNELLFDILDGKIAGISGGAVEICE